MAAAVSAIPMTSLDFMGATSHAVGHEGVCIVGNATPAIEGLSRCVLANALARGLYAERRWPAEADPAGPTAAGFEIFQAVTEIDTSGALRRTRWSRGAG